MNVQSFSWSRFLDLPVVGIIRNLSFEDMMQILPLCEASGLTTLEITMNTPRAEEMIRGALDCCGESLNIGAGTICNEADLEKALKAGARFIVTPSIEVAVIKACVAAHIPVFPGAFSPTEIYRAWELGADMIKVFPVTALGPGYVRDLKGPFPQIKLLPTGGVTLDNATDFLRAGAAGLGMGSQLFDNRLIVQRHWEELRAGFERLVTKIRTLDIRLPG